MTRIFCKQCGHPVKPGRTFCSKGCAEVHAEIKMRAFLPEPVEGRDYLFGTVPQ